MSNPLTMVLINDRGPSSPSFGARERKRAEGIDLFSSLYTHGVTNLKAKTEEGFIFNVHGRPTHPCRATHGENKEILALLPNPRVPAWSGLEGTSGVTQPNPLPKQRHPEQAAQHRVQAGLEHLQRRRLHSLPGQPGPGLRHPQREEVLPHLQLELPVLQFVPVAPCPVAGHHWKESGPILLTPTMQIFRGIYKVPSLLQAEQAQILLFWCC